MTELKSKAEAAMARFIPFMDQNSSVVILRIGTGGLLAVRRRDKEFQIFTSRINFVPRQLAFGRLKDHEFLGLVSVRIDEVMACRQDDVLFGVGDVDVKASSI